MELNSHSRTRSSPKTHVTCCGMPVEKGCLIFAIVNMVICSLSTLVSVAFVVRIWSFWRDEVTRGTNDDGLMWFLMCKSLAYFVSSSVSLAFAFVLCAGVSRNKPGCIMAYLVFGVIKLLFSVLGTIAFMCSLVEQPHEYIYGLIMIGICVTYSGILLLVYRTYAVLTARARVTSHGTLLQKEDCQN